MVAASAVAMALTATEEVARGGVIASSAVTLRKAPRRFLFIASIGNLPAPYTLTRHSAGHTFISHIEPLLRDRVGYVHAALPSHPLFYTTWKCPVLMNVSGPSVLSRLRTWLKDHELHARQLGVIGKDAPRVLKLWRTYTTGKPDGESLERRVRSTRIIGTMKILTNEMRSCRRGPEAWFTGTVWIDEIVTGAAPSRMKVNRSSFTCRPMG